MENKEIEQVLPKEDDFTNRLIKLKSGDIAINAIFITSEDKQNLLKEFEAIEKQLDKK